MDSPLRTQPELDSRDTKKFYYADTFQRRALIVLARALFKPIMKYDVHGLENLPREGPVILAANQVTNFDVFPIQFAIPRVIFFMAKAELFKNPIMNVLLRSLSAFPVNRGEKDQWAMRHAAKVLNYGQVLGMFPEGKRSQGKGLSVAKTGTARTSIEANCPIVAITVTGSDRLFKQFPHRTQVQITLLPAIMPKPDENPLALTDRLMFTLAGSLPAEMRGVYAEIPQGFEF